MTKPVPANKRPNWVADTLADTAKVVNALPVQDRDWAYNIQRSTKLHSGVVIRSKA